MVHTCFCQSMSNPTFFKVRNRISFIETKDISLSHIEYNCNHFTNYKIYIWNMSCAQQFLFQVKTQSTFKASPAKNRNFCEMYYSRKKLHISVMSDQMILVNADSLIAAQVIFCCKKY